MSIKKDLNIIRAVRAAGFNLVDSKSVGTDDGACWEATLAQGRTKLARVSNGGFGGPDETRFLETQKLSITVIRKALNEFFAIPEVQDVVRQNLVEQKGYELEYKHIDQEQFDAAKAEIDAKPVVASEEAVEMTVSYPADAHELLKRVKRQLKTNILFKIEDQSNDAAASWYEVKAADTPANRAKLRERHKIDYFIADLVAGL